MAILQRVASIGAFIFDLDGTLVDTEMLKARAYAAAAGVLLRREVPDSEVIPTYSQLVGKTDEDMSRALVDRLGLAEPLGAEMSRLGVTQPWEALHSLRMGIYLESAGAPDSLDRAAYRHTIDLARTGRAAGRAVAVATSSPTAEARRVLGALGILELFDPVIGRDQIERPKPDPEIFLRTVAELGIEPDRALVVEDSPTGIAAAKAAGMAWVAVANPLTEQRLREAPKADQAWIAYRPGDLRSTVAARLAEAEG